MSAKRILVVDDEPDLCLYLARLFEEHGYSVACASDGYEAANKVKQTRPDLITLDLSMRKKSGVKFYREMKSTSELSRIPIVFVSPASGAGGSFRDAGRARGTRHPLPPPDGVVGKPINADEILGLAGRLIAARQSAGSELRST
jgi:CheY-like chemotaxis protein